MTREEQAAEAARWAAQAVEAGHLKPDFMIHFGETTWTITATTDVAKMFAGECMPVDSGQGPADNFTTDVSAARELCRGLAFEGFTVACRQPNSERLRALHHVLGTL